MNIPILKVLTGSRAYGLETPNSDWDYYEVTVAPTRDILKVHGGPDKHTKDWVRGDTDFSSWEVGHFLNLATKSNPSVLEVFCANRIPIIWNDEQEQLPLYTRMNAVKWGDRLQELFPHVWSSANVKNAFLGYATQQRQRFLAYNDVRSHKYASTHLRILYQGATLLRTGTLPVNLKDSPVYQQCVDWKAGFYTLDEVKETLDYWELKLKFAYECNPNKQTNFEPINEYLWELRKEFW